MSGCCRWGADGKKAVDADADADAEEDNPLQQQVVHVETMRRAEDADRLMRRNGICCLRDF